MKMKFIILLSLIAFALSSKVNLKEKKNTCLDNIHQELSEKCQYYELHCSECYTEKYLNKCVHQCQSSQDNCIDTCKQEDFHYCSKHITKCTECFKEWSECTCPEGMTLIRGNNGERYCDLEECETGFWRDPSSKCTHCDPCHKNCYSCHDNANNCDICKEGFCHIGPDCVDPQTYVCPGELVKSYDQNGCPVCSKECKAGFYVDKKVCKPCNKECTTCVERPDKCNGCIEGWCHFEDKCVKPDYQCPNKLFKHTLVPSSDSRSDKCFICVPCDDCPENDWCNASTHECDSICPVPKFLYERDCKDECPKGTKNEQIEYFEVTAEAKLELNGWTASPKAAITSCEGKPLLGGYKIFGEGSSLQKKFENLPAHQELYIEFQLFLIDTWDQSEKWGYDFLQIYLDNVNVVAYKKLYNEQYNIIRSNCGQADRKDEIIKLRFKVPHTSGTADIKFQSAANQNAHDESWGINKLKIIALNEDDAQFLIYNPPNQNECVTCENCPGNTFCDRHTRKCEVCEEPYFMFEHQCLLVCATGYLLVDDETGVKTCVETCPPGKYIDELSKTCKQCDDNCITCENEATTCTFPCRKGAIFHNGKCINKCPKGYFSYNPDKTYCHFSEFENCQCAKCHNSCEECIGPEVDECISCKDKTKFLDDGKCLDHCSPKEYFDEKEQACNCCHAYCEECYGPAISQCTACTPEAILVGSTCYAKNRIPTLLNQGDK